MHVILHDCQVTEDTPKVKIIFVQKSACMYGNHEDFMGDSASHFRIW